MAYVFISYSHKDREYAHKLADELKRRGIDAWIDDRINYGTEWPKVIQEQLDGCGAFIVILSENAFASKWVQNEVARADRKKKTFFPLLFQGEPWLSVEATQYVDVRTGALPPNPFFETIKKQLGIHKVPAESEQGSQKLKRPLIEQQMIGRIADPIYTAIVNGPDAEWEMGLFKISFRRPAKNPPSWLANYPKSYSIGSEVINMDLLSRYDTVTYLDYKTNHDRIMRKKESMKTTTPVYLDYIPELFALRKRLNLQPGLSSEHKFSRTEVQEFAEQLLDVHKAHHVPIGEIKIKVLK